MKLDDRCWGWIICGLELYQDERAEDNKIDEAKDIEAFIKCLESELGEKMIYGVVEGFKLKARIAGKMKMVQITLCDS